MTNATTTMFGRIMRALPALFLMATVIGGPAMAIQHVQTASAGQIEAGHQASGNAGLFILLGLQRGS